MFRARGIKRLNIAELALAHQEKAIVPVAHITYVCALQVTPNSIENYILSDAVALDDQNLLLKQDWQGMIKGVVTENQRRLVNFATTGIAHALMGLPALKAMSAEERKEAWPAYHNMDPCYNTEKMFARECRVIDFYDIFVAQGEECRKWEDYFRHSFVAVCVVRWTHRLVDPISKEISSTLVRIFLQRQVLNLNLPGIGFTVLPVNAAAGRKLDQGGHHDPRRLRGEGPACRYQQMILDDKTSTRELQEQVGGVVVRLLSSV